MPGIKFTNFDGYYPRTSAYLLPDNAGQTAENVKLFSGELRGWQKSVAVFPQPTLVANPLAIYRLERPTDLASAWLSWQSDVDVVPSPVSDTADGRIYYMGDGAPKKTNYALATSGAAPYPYASLPMGVIAPTVAPTVASTVAGTTPETRAYIYTYISVFGTVFEESAPSPATSVATYVSGDTVHISGLGTTSPAGYNITKKRIYRTSTSANSVDYRLVAEIPITQATYDDSALQVNLPGDPLITLYFTEPPSDLRGLVSMPHGVLAAFRKNEVWFCEPDYPHAWPVSYVLTTAYNVVGLGVVGNMLVVCTERSPELIYGTTPGAFTQDKVPLIEPCASKRSIATDGTAVIYASPNGLIAVGPNDRERVSEKLFRRQEFQEYQPNSLYAKIYDGQYFGWFNAPVRGKGALLMDATDRPALSRLNQYTDAAYVDTRTANLYYVDGIDNHLYQFDADTSNNNTYTWRSKKISWPFPVAMGVLQLYADYKYLKSAVYDPTADIAYNAALIAAGTVRGAISLNAINEFPINGSLLRPVYAPGNVRYVGVTVYGDGRVIASFPFMNEYHKKLPAGLRCRTWEVEINGNAPVYSVYLAPTVADLKDN